jgi:hypothetical protein
MDQDWRHGVIAASSSKKPEIRKEAALLIQHMIETGRLEQKCNLISLEGSRFKLRRARMII